MYGLPANQPTNTFERFGKLQIRMRIQNSLPDKKQFVGFRVTDAGSQLNAPTTTYIYVYAYIDPSGMNGSQVLKTKAMGASQPNKIADPDLHVWDCQPTHRRTNLGKMFREDCRFRFCIHVELPQLNPHRRVPPREARKIRKIQRN